VYSHLPHLHPYLSPITNNIKQLGIRRAYYVAYPLGLIVSFLAFWVCNLIKKPEIMLHGWHEPKNYYRPGEDPEDNRVVEGEEVRDSSSVEGSKRAHGVAEDMEGRKRKGVNVDEKAL
jgi:hypothetical protein